MESNTTPTKWNVSLADAATPSPLRRRYESPRDTAFFSVLKRYRDLAQHRPKLYKKPGTKTEYDHLQQIFDRLEDAKERRNHYQWLKVCQKLLHSHIKTVSLQKIVYLQKFQRLGLQDIGDKYQGTIVAENKIQAIIELLKMELQGLGEEE